MHAVGMDIVSIAIAVAFFALMLGPDRGPGPPVSAAELIGLIVALALALYLLYALFRGEEL